MDRAADLHGRDVDVVPSGLWSSPRPRPGAGRPAGPAGRRARFQPLTRTEMSTVTFSAPADEDQVGVLDEAPDRIALDRLGQGQARSPRARRRGGSGRWASSARASAHARAARRAAFSSPWPYRTAGTRPSRRVRRAAPLPKVGARLGGDADLRHGGHSSCSGISGCAAPPGLRCGGCYAVPWPWPPGGSVRPAQAAPPRTATPAVTAAPPQCSRERSRP